MSIGWTMLLFLGSFALSVISSVVLARRLEQLGAWLRLSQSLLGIVAALGADAPEISSAVTAMHAGQHDLGLGIVLGSNIFNLAALLGLSALVSGKVSVTRQTLLINGSVAVWVMTVVAALLYGALPGTLSIILIVVAMVPYIVFTAISPKLFHSLAARWGFGGGVGRAVAEVDQGAARAEAPPRPSTADLLGTIPALVAIVLASIGMVRSALVLGAHWSISSRLIGAVILASLTGIPNVITAVQLAWKGRGSAVLSEALNSNTFNLIAGIAIPSAIIGLGALSSNAIVSLWWMIGMTILALGLAFVRGGLGRKGGVLLVAIYAAFVVMIVLWR